MNFKDLFNKAVNEAQSFLDKPETKELISKVKQGAVEFKQKAEVFVEESDEKLKKIIEEKFSKKSDEQSVAETEMETKKDVSETIHTAETNVVSNVNVEDKVDLNTTINPVQTEEFKKTKRTTKKVIDIHISQMDFKENLEKTLAEAGFDTKNKLKAASDEQLLELSGVGKATLKVIRDKSA